jgi:hypothetical protein
MHANSEHLTRHSWSIRRSIGIAVVLFAVGAVTPLAFADDTEPPPGGPAISQYVETVPSATGGSAVGVGKSRSKPLPKKAQKKLDRRTTPLAPNLHSIATSSSYGAPQRTLPRHAKPARIKHPRTTAKPTPAPPSRAPRPLARDDSSVRTNRTALSAAVSAATGGGDRAPVILLAAIVLITTAAALSAAARRARQGR